MSTQSPQFLDRRRYRLRRARDAAFVLPVLGAILFFAPVLWGGGSTRSGGLYLFAVWVVLIPAAYALSVRLRKTPGEDGRASRDGAEFD